MRQLFNSIILEKIHVIDTLWALLGGVGYGLRDKHARIINFEASEQAIVDIAVGLALSGQIPIVYCITPHLLRAYESFRLYLDHEQIPVKIIGIGRGRDYDRLGFTHWGEGDKRIFESLPNIQCHWPLTEAELRLQIDTMLTNRKPTYLNVPR